VLPRSDHVLGDGPTHGLDGDLLSGNDCGGQCDYPVTLSIQTANTQTAHNEQPTPG
jgi:hypothetical protein